MRNDLVILGVSWIRKAMKVKPFAQSMNINYPVLVDGRAPPTVSAGSMPSR
jgi:hypothetical protein